MDHTLRNECKYRAAVNPGRWCNFTGVPLHRNAARSNGPGGMFPDWNDANIRAQPLTGLAANCGNSNENAVLGCKMPLKYLAGTHSTSEDSSVRLLILQGVPLIYGNTNLY